MKVWPNHGFSGPLFVGTIAAACLAAGCDVPRADDTAQRAVMHDLAHEVLLPLQGEVEAEAVKLSAAVGAFCDSPTDETLNAAQAAWRAARAPWKRAEVLRFGPSEDLRLGSAIDFWPARTDTIEAAIAAAPEPVTAEHIASLGVSSKGLPALEYLIFDPAGGNTSVLASLGGGDASALRRCAYARALGDAIAADATALHHAWSPEGGAFVDQMANAGTGSSLFPTGQDGVARVVNLLNASMQFTNENKISAPLGLMTGTPDPALVESRFSDNSIEDLLGSLQGVEDVYLGRHGERDARGLTDLVVARSAAIDAAVRKSLGDAQARVSAIPAPLRSAVTTDPASVTATHEAVRTARRLFAIDVASVLSVDITLTDNDGD
jgi:uncharacterized protein